jgi:hypothetical protein
MISRRRYRRKLQPSAFCGVQGPRGVKPAARPRRRGQARAPPVFVADSPMRDGLIHDTRT